MNEIIIVCAAALLYPASWIIGWCRGFRKGNAVGWVECQESIWAKERARRDKRGRFKTIKVP